MAPLIIQRIVCPGCANSLCEWCGKADIYPDYHCVVHSNLVVSAARCPNENCHGLVYRCSEIVEVDGFPYLGDLENFISCELCKYRPVSENIEYIVDIVDIVDIANNNGNNVEDDDDDEDDEDDEGGDDEDDDEDDEEGEDDEDDEDDDGGEGRFPYPVDYDEFLQQIAIERANIADIADIADIAINDADDGLAYSEKSI